MRRRINCENCRGGGSVECPRCNGEGQDNYGQDCRYCMGAGIVICDKCGGSGDLDVEINDDWANMGW